MILLMTKKENKCHQCAGYGVFTGYGDNHNTVLSACPTCSSVHPEQFGLRYQKDDSANNFRFYAIKLPNWLERILMPKVTGG